MRAGWTRGLGVALLAGWVGWNLYWLARGQIPPAVFKVLTGLPAPTTGGTRAMCALARGEVGESLAWNPLAVPLAALFALSVGWLVARLVCQRRLGLPKAFLWAWIGLLAVAWVVKLTGDPAWW